MTQRLLFNLALSRCYYITAVVFKHKFVFEQVYKKYNKRYNKHVLISYKILSITITYRTILL